MKEISPIELKSLIDSGKPYQLIDVRRKDEYDFVNINGELIPMDEITSRVEEVATDKPVIVMCRSGQRSAQVVNYLENSEGFDNVSNLDGGILAYSDEVDPSLPKY